MPPRTLAVTGALITVLALPAAASAAQLDTPLLPCYATTLDGSGSPVTEPVDISASGFTPNSPVDVAINGNVVGDGVLTDANGAIGALSPVQYAVPYVESGQQQFTLTLTDRANPAIVVTATAFSTALGVSSKPRNVAPPSKKVRWKGRGFTAEKPIYAHYIFKGKSRKTVRMTKNPGLCGTFNKRSPQIPFASAATGVWTVQFDQSKRFRRDYQGTFVRLSITVKRTFG
jgi:hypothetical protein